MVANLWWITGVRKAVGDREVIIAPIQVVGSAQDSTPLGSVIAGLVQSRLAQLAQEFKSVQGHREAAGDKRPREAATRVDTNALLLSWGSRSLNIPTGLLDPINVKFAVAGVEVTGLFPWLQRNLTNPNAVSFSAYLDGDRAIISGDLQPLTGRSGRSIRIESSAKADKIADRLAHAILHAHLGADPSSKVSALDLEQFEVLLNTVREVGTLNRRAQRLGTVPPEAFARLLPAVESLLASAPQWLELTYFAAEIADRSGDDPKALEWFRRAGDFPDVGRLSPAIEARIAALAPKAEDGHENKRKTFVKAASDYARRLKLDGADPPVAFAVAKEGPGVIALWHNGRFEVNPDQLDMAGLPEYVALMGRFFSKHRRCLEVEGALADGAFWNDFRIGAQQYILSLEPSLEGKPLPYLNYPSDTQKMLQRIQKAGAPSESVRALALALLDAYECDWKKPDLSRQVQRVNNERKLVEEDVIARALKPTRKANG